MIWVELVFNQQNFRFLRYPGGKQRHLSEFANSLLRRTHIRGLYIEPFVGGGAVFFHVNPRHAILSDINAELIELYLGIQSDPGKVWNIYSGFPASKQAYYEIRDIDTKNMDLHYRAARVLYINRTCFKGMWRHNIHGKFNVGYGGEARRWVITKADLVSVAKRLRSVTLRWSDFESVIDLSKAGDFIFLDPPYCPGERELLHAHYSYGKFDFSEQRRLAQVLTNASNRGVLWAMTNSAHHDILNLYANHTISCLEKGTGKKIGQLSHGTGEALIRNY